MGRCITSSNFCKIIETSLHKFSDVSEVGYGKCSCLRVVDKNEKSHYGKSKSGSKKFVYIPRLELIAAALSVKTSNMILGELQLQELDEYFLDRQQSCAGVHC